MSSLETQISQTTHTFQFRVSVDNEGASVPGGMTAIVALAVDPMEDVLLVPREAVIVTGKGARVIVAQGGGRFQQRKVEAEDLGEDEMVVHSGLTEGERVVVSAQFLLDSEANLQAGLSRLSGGEPTANSVDAPPMQEGAIHETVMQERAIPEKSVDEEAVHEGAPREAGNPAGTVSEGTTPAAPTLEPTAPHGATHEGTMQ